MFNTGFPKNWSTLRKLMFLHALVREVISTLTGAVVSFIGKASTEILGLTADITPVQSGSGDPSPTNVRPITGYTGANIYVSPTQNQGDATTYTVSWSGSAGTVYGGTLDVLAGKLMVTHKSYTMDSSLANVVRSSGKNYYIRRAQTPDSIADGSNHAVLSDKFKAGTSGDGISFLNTSGAIRFNTAQSFDTVADMYAAIGDVMFIYPLATPVEYTLTPQQVAALVGQNYIWADTGDVTVTVKNAA